jgi:hypothetical protein
MRHLLFSLVSCILLVSCSAGPLDLLPSGGTNVAANTQLGQENTQTIGVTEETKQEVRDTQAGEIIQSSLDRSIQAKKVDSITVESGLPMWILWLIIPIILIIYVAWRLPPPEVMFPRSWFFNAHVGQTRREPPLTKNTSEA